MGRRLGETTDNPAPEALERQSQQLWLSVEVLVEGYRARGRITRQLGAARLVDLLNGSDAPFLSLVDAEVTTLGATGAEAVTCQVAYLGRAAICLAIPLQNAPSPPEAPVKSFDYVEKVPHEVVVMLPCFQVRGMIHLPEGVGVDQAPFLHRPAFVPMTSAVALYIPHPDLVWRSEVIIVNMAKAQVYCCGPLPPSSRS
ncbi:MAG: hypothetical protein ACE5IZ_00950 [Dehalococcoidia bacterium]